MSTRFYAGPLSHGMGRRWDDWSDPQRAASTPPGRAAPIAPAALPTSAPRRTFARTDRATPFDALARRS
jgi:hypothetical protein